MRQTYKNGQAGVIVRALLIDSSSPTGAGLTGLTNASAGLIISTIADSEAACTFYAQSAGNIETIAVLGAYAAPSAGKCRFREVSATYHPGLYEFQFADARMAIAAAKGLVISVLGATNLQQNAWLEQLQTDDPFIAKVTRREAGIYDEGAVVAVGTNTVQLRAGSKPIYNGMVIEFDNSTTGDGQEVEVTGYVSGTQIATVTPNIQTAVTLPSNYRVLTNPGAVTSGYPEVELSANGIAELLEALLAGHVTAGTIGFALNAIAAAGDPWATALPGAYAAGSAGAKLSAVTIPPTVAAIRTEMDANSTKLGSIVTRTALIPDAPAAVGSAMALTSGERTSIVTTLFAAITEGTTSFVQAIRGMSSAAMGKSSGLDTANPTYRDLADTKARLTGTTDVSGNRTAVTRDLT